MKYPEGDLLKQKASPVLTAILSQFYQDMRDAFDALATNCQIVGIDIATAAPLAIMSQIYEAVLREMSCNATLEVLGDPRAGKTTPEDFGALALRIAKEVHAMHETPLAEAQAPYMRTPKQ